MSMTVIEFIEDPRMLGDKILSPAQRMAVKSIYGLRLTSEEFDCWVQASGGRRYIEGVEQEEITVLKGRKSGGTDKILTNVLLYECCMRPPKLTIGERAVLMIVTSELKRQSRVTFQYCLDKMEHSRILKKLIRKSTANEIELTNGCVVQIFPSNQARVRSPSILFFGGDECCFWKSEGVSVDREILEAARPGLIFPHSKMIKLSSVGGMRGELFFDHKRYFGVDNAPVLVLKGSTQFFFPGFSQKKLERAERKSPSSYDQEYGANFRLDESSMYDPAQIDRAINHDRPAELPYRGRVGPYFAYADIAGGGGKDSYAIAIGHREGDKIIIDVVRSRSPKPQSFNPEEVTRQYCDLLKGYALREVSGDKFGGDMALNMFAKYGVDYRPMTNAKGAMLSKSDIYIASEAFFTGGKLEIPGRELLITQLQGLVRKTHSGGRDSVDTGQGQSEDEANVICGVAVKIALATGAGEAFLGVPYDRGQAAYCRPEGSDMYVGGGGVDEYTQLMIREGQRRHIEDFKKNNPGTKCGP
jgi:hypothetical protein